MFIFSADKSATTRSSSIFQSIFSKLGSTTVWLPLRYMLLTACVWLSLCSSSLLAQSTYTWQTIDFGSTPVNTPSAPEGFILTASSPWTYTLSISNSEFAVASETCPPGTVVSGGQCEFLFYCDPTSTGVQTGVLSFSIYFTTNPGASYVATAPLVCNGLAPSGGSPAGIITTIAGDGMAGYSGDGVLAIQTSLNGPTGLYLDTSSNIFVADSINNRVREFTRGGNIKTIAGNGSGGNQIYDQGDGGPAIQATTNYPGAMTEDSSGNLYILDEFSNGNNYPIANSDTYAKVRVVSLSSGSISSLSSVRCLPNGNCFSDPNNDIGTFASDLAYGSYANAGANGVSGLYVPAYGASGLFFLVTSPSQLEYDIEDGYAPSAIALDSGGNVYISAAPNPVYQSHPYGERFYGVEEISPTGSITTIAGNGNPSYSGDGGLAVNAGMTPGALAVDNIGNVFIVDLSANVVRVVVSPNNPNFVYSGYIFTVAGSPALPAGFSGDGGPATSAQLNQPQGIKLDSAGNLYISDTLNNRVRFVSNPAGVPGSPIGQLVYSGGGGGGGDDGGPCGGSPCTQVVKAPKRPQQ